MQEKENRKKAKIDETDAKIEEELKSFLQFKRRNHVFRDTARWPDLHLAAQSGHDDLVRYLVTEKGVNIDMVDSKDETPLICAIGYGHRSTARLLLELGARAQYRTSPYDDCHNDPIFHACGKRDYTMIRMLFEFGAAPFEEDIIEVMRGGDIDEALFVFDLTMERLFSKVITGGIYSNTEFFKFLAEGVYDPRILIEIASFAYRPPCRM